MLQCGPTMLLSGIHYRLPPLNKGYDRFGGSFTNDSLTKTLPGEIEHATGWAGILLALSLVILVSVYVCTCICCLYVGRSKKKNCCCSIPQQVLRYTSVFLTILSVLGVVLAFWPVVAMHSAIYSSTNDILEYLPEIARHVVETGLLSAEPRRHTAVICYLVVLTVFLIATASVLCFARRTKRSKCGAGMIIFMMVILAVVTTVVHIVLVALLQFTTVVMYADVCISIYSLDDGDLCMEMIRNASGPSYPNTLKSLDKFCNKTVEHGSILIVIGLALVPLFIVIQFIGFLYGGHMCCQHTKTHEDNSYEMDESGSTFVRSEQLEVVKFLSSIPWDSQHEMVELHSISVYSSTEWANVRSLFQATLPHSTIISIERIHNKWLWQSYDLSRRRLSEKNNDVINEKLLFHGTRKVEPEKIYKSEKGFDFRFANKGLWGEGTYFAVNASYSNGYAYQADTENQTKQLFLALVQTGESCACQQDQSLKKPPEKPRGNDTVFEGERYDSVTGTTNGSQVYVIYDHDKAYPAYIIKYKTE